MHLPGLGSNPVQNTGSFNLETNKSVGKLGNNGVYQLETQSEIKLLAGRSESSIGTSLKNKIINTLTNIGDAIRTSVKQLLHLDRHGSYDVTPESSTQNKTIAGDSKTVPDFAATKNALIIEGSIVGLHKADILQKLTPDSLAADFSTMANGSGALRSPVTGLKGLIQAGSPFAPQAQALLDKEISGIKFSQWGTTGKAAEQKVAQLKNDASKSANSELADITTQLKQAGAQVVHLAKAASDGYKAQHPFTSLLNPFINPDKAGIAKAGLAELTTEFGTENALHIIADARESGIISSSNDSLSYQQLEQLTHRPVLAELVILADINELPEGSIPKTKRHFVVDNLVTLIASDSPKAKSLTDAVYKQAQKEFSTENIDFLKAVNEFKTQIEFNDQQTAFRAIVTQFIKDDADTSVNINSGDRQTILDAFNSHDTALNGVFKEAEKHITNLVKLDTVGRFKGTDAFKEFMDTGLVNA